MAFGRGCGFINGPIRKMGQVSFSAYLIHFGVITFIEKNLSEFFSLNSTGVSAIFWFFAVLCAVIALTYSLSLASYRFVELPMIKLAKELTQPHAALNQKSN